MSNKKIVMLCSECFSTTALYNHISRRFEIDQVITEDPMRGMALARRRIKKLGIIRVAGQVAFSVIVVPILKLTAKKRIAEIIRKYTFDTTLIPADKIRHVSSVNNEEVIELLTKINPDIILVNGTRIISKKILESTKAIFVNMHTGITPRYRGVHGGYWAVVKNDYENCGVTIHLVDKGIDTGGILYQKNINVESKDNYITYPYLQFGEGIPLVEKSMDDILHHGPAPVKPAVPDSFLWYHPTIWQYLYNLIFRGKK